MYKVFIALAALISAASAKKCKFPPQTPDPPGFLGTCQDGIQTFALQGFNCSSPYNGLYVQITSSASFGLGSGTWQFNNGGPIVSFYLNGTTVYPVSNTTPDPSSFNTSTPLSAPYSLTGQGTSSIAGPLQLAGTYHQGSGDGQLKIPCKISKGYFTCVAPRTHGKLINAQDLNGPPTTDSTGTIYLSNEVAPHNPNDGDTDYQFPMAFKVVNTCKM